MILVVTSDCAIGKSSRPPNGGKKHGLPDVRRARSIAIEVLRYWSKAPLARLGRPVGPKKTPATVEIFPKAAWELRLVAVALYHQQAGRFARAKAVSKVRPLMPGAAHGANNHAPNG